MRKRDGSFFRVDYHTPERVESYIARNFAFKLFNGR